MSGRGIWHKNLQKMDLKQGALHAIIEISKIITFNSQDDSFVSNHLCLITKETSEDRFLQVTMLVVLQNNYKVTNKDVSFNEELSIDHHLKYTHIRGHPNPPNEWAPTMTEKDFMD